MDDQLNIDCHVHIIDPKRFPYSEGPGYKPRPHETGTRDALRAVLDAHGVSHALLVQPSCYGYDNSAMVDAIRSAPDRYKGIAVVDPTAAEHELEILTAAGVVGVRFNLSIYEPDALTHPEAEQFLRQVRDLGWFAQVYADDVQWAEASDLLSRSSVRVLIDHLGVSEIEGGIEQPGFQEVLRLGRGGQAIVKLSPPLGFLQAPNSSADLRPFVDALFDNFGVDRCIWGSDWPFLGARRPVAYGDTASVLRDWLPDRRDREQVLWQNPVRLFGFGG